MLQAARQWQKSAMLSRNAGGYLCNYVYWRTLEAAKKQDGPKLVAFVHIPPIRRPWAKGASRGTGLPSLDGLAKAGEAILTAVAAALPRAAH